MFHRVVTWRVMSILAYGLNYRTAPLDLRERVAFPEESLGAVLRDIRQDLPCLLYTSDAADE